MTDIVSCPHESDVIDLVAMEQWPERADQALRDHAASCPVCGDLAIAASAVMALRESSQEIVRLPDASVIWYQAEQRARAAATREAVRPMLMAQAAAGILIVTVAVGWASGVLERLAGGVLAEWTWTSLVEGASGFLSWGLAGLVVCALLVPVALWLAALVDRGGGTQLDPHLNPRGRS